MFVDRCGSKMGSVFTQGSDFMCGDRAGGGALANGKMDHPEIALQVVVNRGQGRLRARWRRSAAEAQVTAALRKC